MCIRHVEWGDSHETLPQFLKENPDHRCDLLSIDGEHTPSGVLKDLQALLPVANPGATVLIDDCSTYNIIITMALGVVRPPLLL